MEYYKLEEKNWWFKGRRDIVLKLVAGLDRNSFILDIGCSGGATMRLLKEKGFNNVCGIDLNGEAIEACKAKGIKRVFVMDASKTGFSDNEFDAIIASDVLEHIKGDDLALAEWKRILKPGGKLIVFVPAFKFLWREVDEVSRHYRRYSKSDLVGLLKKFGFKTIRSSYWNFVLFLPAVLEKVFLLKNRPRPLNSLSNGFLTMLLKSENLILKISDLPIGVSTFAVAEKMK